MRRLIIVVALLFCCAKQESPVPTTRQKTLDDDAQERLSLFDLAHGATIAARSGEAMLEVSALRAIDGDPGSFWMTPPQDLPQSTIITIPTRSRIEKVGIRTVAKGSFTANHVLFETSLDGKAFTPITTITSSDSSEAQWFDVSPTEAAQIRVTMVDSLLPGHDVRLCSILARGTELEPPRAGDITGCWSINGRPARFARRGSRVIGILEMGKEPIRFDGGFDGRTYRLNWIRGNDYGMALVTVAPGGQHLSGIQWHEEVIPMFFGDSWFGMKQTCSSSITDSGEVVRGLLHRTGRFPLYTTSDDLLRIVSEIVNARRNDLRFVAHEFRQATPEQNRQVAQRELESLRRQLESAGVNLDGVNFVTQGSQAPREKPVTEAMRALYSSVDLEIRR